MPKRSSENLNSQDMRLDPNASKNKVLGFLLRLQNVKHALADLSG